MAMKAYLLLHNRSFLNPHPTPPLSLIYISITSLIRINLLLNLSQEMPLEGTTATRAALPIPAGALVLTCYDAMGIVCWSMAKAAGVTFVPPPPFSSISSDCRGIFPVLSQNKGNYSTGRVSRRYPVALACLVYTASHALASCNNPLLC